eukprot:UN4959
MPHLRINPDVISCSAAMSACEKGGQWQAALAVLRTMPHLRINPNVISCNAAVSACAKGDRWQMALHLFRSMVGVGLSPDAVTYSAVLDAVFDRGDAWEVFSEGVSRGFFPRLLAAGSGKIDLHGMSPGAALMAVCRKLSQMVSRKSAGLAVNPRLLIITGWGKSRTEAKDALAVFTIKEAVREMLEALNLPVLKQPNPGRLLTTVRDADTLP